MRAQRLARRQSSRALHAKEKHSPGVGFADLLRDLRFPAHGYANHRRGPRPAKCAKLDRSAAQDVVLRKNKGHRPIFRQRTQYCGDTTRTVLQPERLPENGIGRIHRTLIRHTHLPTQPIEVAIAASIAVAGGINLLPKLSRLRLPLAFGFGFVHGFGFANALSEIDASGATLLPLLAGFNIGVEIAQLSIVALVLPAIYLARGTRWYASGVMPLGSCALGAAGIVWLLQRL